MSHPSLNGTKPSHVVIDALLHWFASHGGEAPGLEIVTFNGLRGVRTNRAIAKDERVLFMPRSSLLSVEVAKQSVIGRKVADSGDGGVSDRGYLALFMLDELRRQGPWAAYLEALPRDFAGHPFLFDEDELRFMHGSFAFMKNEVHRGCVATDFDKIDACLPEHERFGFAAFKWAWCCVLTRLRRGSMRPDSKSAAIFPISEMFNHAMEANTDWEESDAGFLLKAIAPIAAGDTLHDSYGHFGNGSLFATWGFRLDGNPHNEMILRFVGAEPSDSLVMFVGDSYRRAKTRETFSFLRLRHHAPAQGSDASRPAADELNRPISKENELAALAALNDACANRREVFGSDGANGASIPMPDPGLPRHLRDAAMVRREELCLLQHYERLARTAIAFLKDEGTANAREWRAELADDDYFNEICRLAVSESLASR